MAAIPSEQILRLNCPGYGEESYLTLGRARALDSYSVIVANPVSILHLFDRDPDSVREIDNKLSDGISSYNVRNDEILQDIETDLKQRIFELVSFLERGGLLVYFLARPFMVQGPASAMDNYYWLESLAPDSPAELNVRHMSAVSQGRIVEPTEQAEKSEFAKYFKQGGLEWSTIIRSDFLTEGYIVLATAGPRKCIAAHLIAGDNGGRILFLPAPYSPDFDRTLMDCVNIWNQSKQSGRAIGMGAVQATSAPTQEISSLQNAPPAPAFGAPPTMFAGLDAAYYSNSSPAAEPAAAAAAPAPAQAQTQNPTAPPNYMPPVPKFNPEKGPSPSAVGSPKHIAQAETGMLSTDDVLKAVNAYAAAHPGLGKREQKGAEIDRQRGADKPAAPGGDGNHTKEEAPSPLLKELESMMAPETPPPLPVPPPPSNGQPRNLLREMETMVENQEPPPAEERESKTDEPLDYKYGMEQQQKNATGGYQFALSQRETEQPLLAEDFEIQQSEQLQTETEPVTPVIQSTAPVAPPRAHDSDNNKNETEQSNGVAIPEAKDLMKKMEETMIKTAAPDWCANFTFPDLDDLRNERESLAETIRQTQTKITTIDNKIAMLDGLKNALLAADGDDLKSACGRVFKRLGWNPMQSDSEMKELILVGKENAEVIARVVKSPAGAPRPDIAQLAQSVLTFWGETEIEPKGIMIACTYANIAPKERTEPDYTDSMVDFAQKKSLCLMTTMQLLCIYRDLELGKMEAEDIKERILGTSGRLSGFEFEPAAKSRA